MANAWLCVLCGQPHSYTTAPIEREGTQCTGCGSTWRNRATIVGLMLGLRIEPRPYPRLPSDWSRRGVGFDDPPCLFSRLPSRLLYANTHLDRFPKLDLLDPSPEATAAFEFALCADVLEHVPPPVQRAFDGLASILEPAGFAVISVPVRAIPTTVEHYVGLTDYELVDGPAVRWRDAEGTWHLDEAPEMHGGTGLGLAFRQFGVDGVRSCATAAGFASVEEVPAIPELGVPELDEGGVYLARTA